MPALGRIEHIIWHCSATPNGEPFTAADIQRWHKQNGWSGIGYHFVIGTKGELWSGREIKYNYFQSGAHTRGKNSNSLGVCVIGGTDQNGKATYDPQGSWLSYEQEMTIDSVYSFLSQLAPQARHSGHRDWARKDCPCFEIEQVIDRIRRESPKIREVSIDFTKPDRGSAQPVIDIFDDLEDGR